MSNTVEPPARVQVGSVARVVQCRCHPGTPQPGGRPGMLAENIVAMALGGWPAGGLCHREAGNIHVVILMFI
jgi:hypothetical protein